MQPTYAPIKIHRPEIYQKIRNRLGVETGIGRSAELLMSIQPILDIDPLLLVSEVFYASATISADGDASMGTVPAGEFWHLKAASVHGGATGTYDLALGILGRDKAGNARTVYLSVPVAATGIWMPVPALNGLTLRPGDQLQRSVTGYSVGSTATIAVWYDLEDCSS